MKWISCTERLPADGVEVITWCAESSEYTAGVVEAKRTKGEWKADNERFWNESQDANVFVTHWIKLEPPDGVPSKQAMAALLGETVY